MRLAPLVVLPALLVLFGALGACSEGSDAPGPVADGGASSEGGDALSNAVATCDASGVTEAQLLGDLQAGLAALEPGRRSVWNAIYRLSADGSANPGSVGALTWDPTHDSATLDSADFERNVPIVIANKAQSGASHHLALGMVGVAGAARYAVFGANLIHTIEAAKVPDAQLQGLAEGTLAWLMKSDQLKTKAFKVVEAHLPNQYYFPHEPSTRKWLSETYPSATLNAGYCESALLDGCLSGADLLVISMDTGPDNNHAVPYDGDAVMKAVTAAQARGVPVLYLHYYREPSDLGQRLMRHFRMTATSNYWNIEQLAGFDPKTDYPVSGDLAALRAMVGTLREKSLSIADYQSCLPAADHLWDCASAPFADKLMTGATALRSALNALDLQAEPICAGGDRRLLKELVLLGDKYRSGDALTKAIAYPVDPAADPAGLARAAFADHAVLLTRGSNAAQSDLGSYTCAWSDRMVKTCTGVGYDPATVPLTTVTASASVPAFSSWTSTGAYAVPGVALTVTRTDALGSGVVVRAMVGFQRAGSTHSLAKGKYTRPQYLQSAAVLLAPSQPVVLSTPYGGPVYLQISPSDAAAPGPAPVTVKLERVGRHPAVLDVSDPAQLAAFPADLQSNPLPHVDLRAPGFEIHLRRDKVLATVAKQYGGDTAAFLNDIRHNYIDQVYGLAGFKLPGVPLSKSLSADVQAECAHFGWNCTDETVHVRKTVQHANFDEYALCGDGCSGNPFDADWSIDPIGWGESHELGHNLQMKQLNIAVTDAAHADDWSTYKDRATENSNNMFPYHTLWNYRRVVKGDVGPVADGHMDHKDLFAAVQSDLAGLTRAVNNVQRRVVFDSKCNRLGDYPAASAGNRFDAIWLDGGYAANNGLRMSFYLQLPLMAHGQPLAGGTVLSNGFDLIVLLYEQARLFQAAAATTATWSSGRAALGFETFPFDGHATYAANTVSAIPGNDFLVVALSWLTAKDYRPYFDSRGVRYSALASKQVDAHVAAKRVTGVVDARMFALGAELPTLQLGAAPRVALDGVAKWPVDGWHPSMCP